jgi:hypothetical protein
LGAEYKQLLVIDSDCHGILRRNADHTQDKIIDYLKASQTVTPFAPALTAK